MNYDLAIFGSGFAAYEIARVATARGQTVAVIEKGTEELSANPEMSRVPFRREPIMSGGFDFGAQVPAAFDTLPRYVGLGGTSELWSGKWRRMDALDLERSHNGRRWLVGHGEMQSYYDKVDANYGRPDWSCDTAFGEYSKLVAAHGLRVVEIYEEAPPLRIRPKWTVLRQQGADVFCEANVAEAVYDPGGNWIYSVRVLSGGREHIISAKQFVVACGGIESVHLSHELRASKSQHGWHNLLSVRYGGFMDHPKAFVGEVVPKRSLPLLEYLQDTRSRLNRLLAFSLPERELATENLGNHTVFLWAERTAVPQHPLQMVINLEQFPEQDNFVTRSPTPAVSWRMSRRTWTDCQAFLKVFVPRVTKMIGRVTYHDTLTFRGASHHMGALPMGEPGDGHLDRNCRFYDVTNLYCVSSAVFPVAGSANPTMTVVALARRLADHLQARECG